MERAELKFKKYLSSQKLKYTPERRKIFSEIIASRGHFDADDLIMRLRTHNKTVSRATVYRTLDLLVKLGFLRKVCLGDKSSLYENNLYWTPHGHFVCIPCGKVQRFKIPKVIDQTLEKVCSEYQFQTQNRCVQVFGYCQDCQDKALISLAQKENR